MFSAMVRCSICGSWGTYAMWRRSECCVTCAMSCPSMAMTPPSRSAKRSSSLVSVVLPEPEGPTSPTCSPGLDPQVQTLEQRRPGPVGEAQVAELDEPVGHHHLRGAGDVDDVGSVAAMPANLAQRPMARDMSRMNSKDSSRLVPTKVA